MKNIFDTVRGTLAAGILGFGVLLVQPVVAPNLINTTAVAESVNTGGGNFARKGIRFEGDVLRRRGMSGEFGCRNPWVPGSEHACGGRRMGRSLGYSPRYGALGHGGYGRRGGGYRYGYHQEVTTEGSFAVHRGTVLVPRQLMLDEAPIAPPSRMSAPAPQVAAPDDDAPRRAHVIALQAIAGKRVDY